MNNRCKFCGYRFKDKGEQICPECLTAREEDITCGSFGEDDHSHAVYDDRYFSSQTYARNDTFRDGRAEFLNDERRAENRTAASKYEKRNGGDISMEMNSGRAQPFGYGYDPQNIRPSERGYNPPANGQGKPNGCGKGCLVFIILMVILVSCFFYLADHPKAVEKLFGGKLNTENTVQTEQGEMSCFFVSSVRDEIDSDSEDLNTFTKKNLFLIENGEMVESSDASARKLYSYQCEFRFKYEDNSPVSRDDLDIKNVHCAAFDADDNIISSYDGFVSDKVLITVGSQSSIRPTLLCDSECSRVVISIDAEFKGESVSYDFEI